MLRFFENWHTYEAIRSITAAHDLTVVVGAGASMEAGLPSWGQLVESLLDDALAERGWTRDGPAIKQYAGRNGLLTAAEVASALLESDLGDKVKERLYQGADASSLTPGPLANAVAALQHAFGPRMSIGTFSYDDLIETALRARPTAARWWSHVRSYIQQREPQPNSVGVTHLHGLRGREDKGHVVLTESDYQIMQTSTSCWQEDWFIARLRASSCLFVGISMSDPNLLRYLHRARHVGRPHYALLLRDDERDDRPSGNDRIASRPSATSRERCEETERLRWAKLGVTVLFVDNYADVAQFIWELVLRREQEDRYQSLPRRLRAWWSAEEARGCLFAGSEPGYQLLQDNLHDALRDILADVRGELASEVPRIRRETLQVTLWAIAPPEAGEQQERVRTLAHTDRVMTDPRTRETIPLTSASNWTGVRCLCLGRPIHDPQDNYASRWKYVVGVPIFRDAPRTPLGALTIASMTPARRTALAALSPRAIGSLDRLAQVAAAPWLKMSS